MAHTPCRVAVELGVHKALPRLEKILASDSSHPESHRPLITAARTWLALYVFEVCYLLRRTGTLSYALFAVISTKYHLELDGRQ